MVNCVTHGDSIEGGEDGGRCKRWGEGGVGVAKHFGERRVGEH